MHVRLLRAQKTSSRRMVSVLALLSVGIMNSRACAWGRGAYELADGSTDCITFLDAGRKRASPDVAKDGKKADAKRRKSSKGKQEAADEEEAGSDSDADVAAADADDKDDAAVSEDGDAGGCS